MVDAMLQDSPGLLETVARDLGTQAVIGHLPVRMDGDVLKVLDYRARSERPLTERLGGMPLEWMAEVMVTDWSNEGHHERFDERMLSVSTNVDKPLLCFGGISQPEQIQRVLAHPQVVAAGVGNFLNYREHAIQVLKQDLGNRSMRMPHYESKNWD